jgi:thiamine pyrophosphokinase
MAFMKKSALILADGNPCPPARLRELRRGRFVIALDGAARRFRGAEGKPDLILGDFDSLRPAHLANFAHRGVRVIFAPDQNFTDLEKALTWCRSEGFHSVWVAQAQGDRLDHSLASLIFLKRFHRRFRELVLVTDSERVTYLEDQRVRILGASGRRIALIPFPRCRARSHGLVYELNNIWLEIGTRESVANQAKGKAVEIEVGKGGALLIEGSQE